MINKSFKYSVGIGGIASAIFYILSIIGLQSYLATGMNDMVAFSENIVNSHTMMLMYGWPGIIATILILPLIYVFYKNNHSSNAYSKMVFIITVIGLSFILVGYLFHLSFTYFFAPIHLGLEPSQQRIFGVIIKSIVGLQDMFWLGGDILAFLGIAIILMLGWNEGEYPKWFLGLGILSGILSSIGSTSFIPAFKHIPGLSFLFIGGFSVFAIWEIIAGILLIRTQKSPQ